MKDKPPIPVEASLQNVKKYVLLNKRISAIDPNIICANLNLALEAEYLPTLKQPQGLIPVPEFGSVHLSG